MTITTRNLLAACGAVLALLLSLAAAQTPPPEGDAPRTAAIGGAAPGFALPDYDGKVHRLADFQGRIVVLLWFNADCPFVVNVFRGEVIASTLEKLEQIAPDAVILAVDSTANKPRGEVVDDGRKFLKRYAVELPVLVDYDGAVGHLYDARTTPHAFVIDAEGILRYHGELTNDPLGRKPDAANRVVDAVAAVTKSEAVTPDYVRPWGCRVKFAKE
jgi:alkyl hydroperoxide reductase subunit AhpC